MFQPRRRRAALLRCAIAVMLALAPMAALAQRGAVTAPVTLDQMIARAETIIRGQIVSTRLEPHPEFRNLMTRVVTLRVARVLKGSAGQTFTFRQFVWDEHDSRSAAAYRKGGEVLLLLRAPSQYGLSSSIGLEQGFFRVSRDAQGQAVATNGRGNSDLFRNLPEAAADKGVKFSARAAAVIRTHQQGPVALQELEDIIARMASQ